MNKAIPIFLCFLFLCFLMPPIQAYEGSGWVFGSMASGLAEVQYASVFNVWNFTVTNASWSFSSFPVSLVCVTPRIAAGSQFGSILIGQTVNFTGSFITDSQDPTGIPVGYFLVTNIDLSSSFQTSPWTDTLKSLFIAIGSIGKMLVTLLVQAVSAMIGFTIPDYVAGAIIVGMTSIFFVRYFKKLPWFIVIIVFFVCVAIISNIILSFSL